MKRSCERHEFHQSYWILISDALTNYILSNIVVCSIYLALKKLTGLLWWRGQRGPVITHPSVLYY